MHDRFWNHVDLRVSNEFNRRRQTLRKCMLFRIGLRRMDETCCEKCRHTHRMHRCHKCSLYPVLVRIPILKMKTEKKYPSSIVLIRAKIYYRNKMQIEILISICEYDFKVKFDFVGYSKIVSVLPKLLQLLKQ